MPDTHPTIVEMSENQELHIDPIPEITALLDQRSEGPSSEGAAVQLGPNLKVKAYELFLTTNDTVESIALKLEIPIFVVKHWVAVERWGDRKAQFQVQLYRTVESEHHKFVLDNRLVTAKRHLASAKLLEEQILWMLEQINVSKPPPQTLDSPAPPKPETLPEEGRRGRRRNPVMAGIPAGMDMTLLRLSQALKTATDVSARAVGISEAGVASAGAQQAGPATVIVVGGRPTGHTMKPALDVTVSPPRLSQASPSPQVTGESP